MVLVPLRLCLAPGCSTRVEKGRCAVHTRAKEQERGSFRARGYSGKWDRSARAFRQRYPLCGMRPNSQPPVMSQCHDEGRVTAAYQTDHVIPHKGDQALFWDAGHNWQSLCAECGARKSQAGL